MTAHAVAHSGSRQEVGSIETRDRTSKGAQRPAGASNPAGAKAAEVARCSPDPWQHTDRYRLVTPFSLRL